MPVDPGISLQSFHWWNAFLLALLTAGHTTLWVGSVNRFHSLPWSNRVLQPIRHLHELAIVLFPLLVLWFVGLTGPQLLWRGGWADLSAFWKIVFFICSLGLVAQGLQTAQHLFHAVPRQVLKHTIRIFDIGQELGGSPISEGPYRRLACLPFNEQFQLELSEKTVQLPGLPSEWDGLTILHLSDWHFSGTISRAYFDRVTEIAEETPVDLVCFTGDLIDTPELVDWIPGTLGRLHGKYGQFYILGNHDWNHDLAPIHQSLSSLDWQAVSSTTVSVAIAGRRLAIGGDETPWMGGHPRFPEDADFRLLLSHTPDNVYRAQKQQIDLMLSGHNHGGQVRIPGIGPVFSPSWYGCRFASGVFWVAPTFLHVSRGLAGIHPLRWRCRPEITRLTLRSGS